MGLRGAVICWLDFGLFILIVSVLVLVYYEEVGIKSNFRPKQSRRKLYGGSSRVW
jgi:hypothetical protein